MKEIYANRKANVKKSPWYESLDSAAGALSTHAETNRERHAFKRRVLDHAFSDGAIRSAETFIVDNIRTWCVHLGQGAEAGEWTPEKSMSDWCTYVAYDIMGDLVFGKRFNVMGNDEHRFVPPMMMSALSFIYPVPKLPFPSYPAPLSFPKGESLPLFAKSTNLFTRQATSPSKPS